MNIIDRRLNPNGKNLPNRQRFLRRARKIVRDAVRKASASRSIRDVDSAGIVVIPGDGIDEPSFHLGDDGVREPVLPGNKEFVAGDKLRRPPGGSGGGGSKAGEGKSEDEYQIALSADEFLAFFLEDLELPDLVRRKLSTLEHEGVKRAGYSTSGSPSSISVSRTMRNAMSRRLALGRPKAAELTLAEAQLAQAEASQATDAEVDELRARIDGLRRRSRAVSFIDPIDIRYRRFEPLPKPTAQAVMFCLMDVSASMSEHMKDVAKRFFMLLYVFLHKRYKKVDIVFIRHTDEAEQVDEETFFNSTESGGTRVSSALALTREIIRERYGADQWNIYVAQASDGDNDPRDNVAATGLMSQELLPFAQYFAYLEVNEPGYSGSPSSLWRAYEALGDARLAQRLVTSREEIYPVFRELFARGGVKAGGAT